MDIDKELENLFDDPLLDLSEQEAGLFDFPEEMKRVMAAKRVQPDYYAQKKPCEDFELYRGMFQQVQKELKEGKRSLVRSSKTSNMNAGYFYVMGGMLVYLAEIKETKRSRNGMIDGRTRCIFENGTESDLLLETVRRNVVNDGYGVTEPNEKEESDFSQTMSEGDRATGFVYVLRSLSSAPEIAGVKDLYKIGFTVNSVEERIANAVHEPTYLMAPVEIKLTAQIVNMNSHIFESLVHQFFHAVQFQVKVYDDEGVEHVPSEWYVAPLEIIETVIGKIADGSITQYSYNAELKSLEKRVFKNTSTFNTKGLKVLKMTVNDSEISSIAEGRTKEFSRELKQNVLNKFTYIDEADNKRYLRRYDVINFVSGKGSGQKSVLVKVEDISFKEGVVNFRLGLVLESVNTDL
jgi:hypothetical protein